MVDIRPNQLPDAITPLRNGDTFIVDQGVDGVRKTDMTSVVDSTAPVATQPEAVAGSDNTKRMTPLRTKQSIASEVGISLASNIQGAKADSAVQSVNGKSGNAVTLVKADVGLGNVDNTSDINKPVSTATQNALNLKANDSIVVKTVNGLSPTAGNVNVSARELRLQNSLTTAAADTYSSEILFIETSGYANPGDGGGANYKLVSSEPSHPGKFQSADGKWWEIYGDFIDPRMLGAKTDGVTDCTSSFYNSSVVANSINARRVLIPSAIMYCSDNVTTNGNIEFCGYGIGRSKIIFSPGKGWTHNLQPRTWWQPETAYFHDFSLLSDGDASSGSTLLRVESPPPVTGQGSTDPIVIIEKIQCSGTEAFKEPTVGIHLFNITNLRMSDIHMLGQINAQLKDMVESSGIIIETDSQAVDMYLNRITVNFFKKGIEIKGASVTGTGEEGIVISDSLMIGVDYGVYAVSDYFLPYLVIKCCNIAAGQKCVFIRNWLAFQVLDNFFYLRERGDNTAWTGVDYGSTIDGYDFPNQISGNMMYPISFTDSPDRYGITVSQANSTSPKVDIGNNSFNYLLYGIAIAAGCKGINVFDTNTYGPNVTSQVANNSTEATVIVARSVKSINGLSVNNKGIETKWGVSFVTIDSTLRGNIVFPSSFISSCYNVQVTNNFADGKSSHAIVADSYGVSGFSVYINEGTSGSQYQIAWTAIGS